MKKQTKQAQNSTHKQLPDTVGDSNTNKGKEPMNTKNADDPSTVLSTTAVAEMLRVPHHLLFDYLESLGWVTRFPERTVTGEVPEHAYVYAGGSSRRILWTASGTELISKQIAADIDAARENREFIDDLLRTDLARIPAVTSATAQHGASGAAERSSL
jgi:hypothetical protein